MQLPWCLPSDPSGLRPAASWCPPEEAACSARARLRPPRAPASPGQPATRAAPADKAGLRLDRAAVLEDVDAIFGDEDLVVGHVVLERLLQQLTACLDELHRLLLVQVGPRLGPRVRRRRRAELLTDVCAHVLDDFERCRRAVLDDVSHQAVVHHGRPVTSGAHAQRRRAGPRERDCGCQHCYRANVPRPDAAQPVLLDRLVWRNQRVSSFAVS